MPTLLVVSLRVPWGKLPPCSMMLETWGGRPSSGSLHGHLLTTLQGQLAEGVLRGQTLLVE